MKIARFLISASACIGATALSLFSGLQENGASSVGSEAPPTPQIGSPGSLRLSLDLPYYAYRMSMGTRRTGSISLQGDSEPVRLRAGLDARRRRVSLLLTHGEDTSTMFATPKHQQLTYHDVAFPATSLAVMANGSLVIAGLDETTFLPTYEIWVLDEPRLVRDDAGKPTFSEPAFLSKTRVTAHAEDLNYGVAQAIWTGGSIADGRVWIYTYPEADIRSLNLQTGQSRVMLSPTAAVGPVAACPELDGHWDHVRHWGHHTACGDCFRLSLVSDVSFEDGKFTAIVLMDRNRDGLLDDWTQLYAQQESPYGLDDREMWVKE